MNSRNANFSKPSTGVFQNRIRIGKNPALILFGDKTFVIKCTYGLPEINQLDMPFINPSFNAVTLTQEMDDNDDYTLISWPIFASIIGSLFVIIIILMFAFICFRWRIECKGRNLQGQHATSNGSFVEIYSILNLKFSNIILNSSIFS
ncbi:unnamed protein product [Onchocerca flexuosa]|uniref:ZP domain-containing protein n=1 Tax=Onchocerca flexuosa TaxID=387005 RepID=A0A183I6U3_9BILA|nr:unnamed protein product [Onchocerca flexuosa]